MEYSFKPITLGNRTVNFRNWKVRDRIKLKDALKKSQSPEETGKAILQILLFDCLDKKYALNPDEINYVLLKMRSSSIGLDDMSYTWFCPECTKKNTYSVDPNNLFKTTFSDSKVIKNGDITIELDEVKNVDIYNKKVSASDSPYFDDLLMHIKSINSDDGMSFEEVKRFFEDLDTKVLDEIMDEYDKIRFKIDSEKEVVCSDCGHKTSVIVDINNANLIPPKWLQR